MMKRKIQIFYKIKIFYLKVKSKIKLSVCVTFFTILYKKKRERVNKKESRRVNIIRKISFGIFFF